MFSVLENIKSVNRANLDRLITDALAIEVQDAKEAGALGYMARALVQATGGLYLQPSATHIPLRPRFGAHHHG
jgi:hypothetical protein